MQNENQKAQISSNNSSPNGWTADEKKAIAAVAFPLIEMQKQYGRVLDAKLVMQGWEIKFAGRFSIQQLLYALDQYSDNHDDFPSPANIVDILEPKEPEITTAQYVAAQDWQKRNGYPMFSDAKETIERYEGQQDKKHKRHKAALGHIQQMAISSIKRINAIADNSGEKIG